jgi:hypothetical protein
MVPIARASIVSACQSLPVSKLKGPRTITEPVIDHGAFSIVDFFAMLVFYSVAGLPPRILMVLCAANVQYRNVYVTRNIKGSTLLQTGFL